MPLIRSSATPLADGYLDRTPVFQYVLLSVCFPMWGAAASLNDILITQFKSIFELSDFASAFVQSAFYGGYFVVAIPASRIIRRTSYRTGLLIGLSAYIIGCMLFWPASHVATYTVFLAALFAVAIGLSFLETSANTYSSMIGPRRTATLRINISQTFTPAGFMAGALLGKYLVFGEGDSLQQQFSGLGEQGRRALAEHMLHRTLQPYLVIVLVLVVLLVLISLTQFPQGRVEETAQQQSAAGLGETLGHLLRNRNFVAGIAAQFVYVGLQTALWSFTIRLALNLDASINERTASTYIVWAYVAFFLGKVLANLLMSRVNANLVLVVYSALGAAALVWTMTAPNMSAVWAAVFASGMMGPGWATIYGRALDSVTDKRYTETGGAILVMAIIGGAVVPLVQGYVSDAIGSLQVSFVVCAVCFLLILAHFARLWAVEHRAGTTLSELDEAGRPLPAEQAPAPAAPRTAEPR